MLDDRKLQILKAIIDSYVKHAEPVGSRTLSKQYDLGVSSATIRNEMSDLEELGMLNKQHTSSGRVPSDKAFRFYVDYFLDRKNVLTKSEADQIREQLMGVQFEVEDMVKTSVKFLGDMTGHTILLLMNRTHHKGLKFVRLVHMDTNTIVAVFIGETKTPESYIVHMFHPVDEFITIQLETCLNHPCIVDEHLEPMVKWGIIKKETPREYRQYLDVFKPYVLRAFSREMQWNLYSYGITNLLTFPDYQDIDHLKELMQFLAREEEMAKVMWKEENDNEPEIMIGSEMEHELLTDSSMITGDFTINGHRVGRIALVGPVRMDYNRMVNTLWSFSTLINKL